MFDHSRTDQWVFTLPDGGRDPKGTTVSRLNLSLDSLSMMSHPRRKSSLRRECQPFRDPSTLRRMRSAGFTWTPDGNVYEVASRIGAT
jgi:hypothetical protein